MQGWSTLQHYHRLSHSQVEQHGPKHHWQVHAPQSLPRSAVLFHVGCLQNTWVSWPVQPGLHIHSDVLTWSSYWIRRVNTNHVIKFSSRIQMQQESHRANYTGSALVKLLLLLYQHGNYFLATQLALRQDKIAQRMISLYCLCTWSALDELFTDI